MARPRKYSDEQRAEALAVYATEGATAASERFGIDKGLISRWGKATGIATVVKLQTQEATQTIAERRAEKREQIREALLDRVVDLNKRMDEQHIEFKGKDATPVVYPKAPSGSVAAYSSSIATLLQEYRKEIGEVPGRGTGQVVDVVAIFARVAQQNGVDPAELEAEVQRMMAEGVVEGNATRISENGNG